MTALTSITQHDLAEMPAQQLCQLLLGHAKTLQTVDLALKDFAQPLDLQALDWTRLPNLQQVTLRRLKVSPTLLSHPQLQRLQCTTCEFAPSPSVQLGRQLQTIDLRDCNPAIQQLMIESQQLHTFSLSQDEDAAEENFAEVIVQAPSLRSFAWRSVLPTRLVFRGSFPELPIETLKIVAGSYGRIVLDVTGVDSGSKSGN